MEPKADPPRAYAFKLNQQGVSAGGLQPLTLGVLDRTRGYYNIRYQGPWEIERARRITQITGYGEAMIRILINAAVGPKGFEIKFENPVHQGAWDLWHWNHRRSWERFDEALRDAAVHIVRDGEAMTEMQYYQGRVMMMMVDPLDVPLGGQYGIDLGLMGEPLRYHVRPYISNNYYLSPLYAHTVEASNFIHVFPEDYARQIRGISWLRPAIDRLEELEDLLVSGYSVIKKSLNLGGIIRLDKSWNIEPPVNDDGDFVNEDDTVMSDAEVESYSEARLNEAVSVAPDRLAVVKANEKEIEYLELKTATPLPPGYEPLVKSYLASCARSVGLSYFSLTGDVSSANYSSLRFGLMADKRSTERVQRLLEGYTYEVIRRWGQFMSVITPGWPDGWTDYEVIKPRAPDVEPVRDAQARAIDIKSGFKSPQEFIREDGRDPAAVEADFAVWTGPKLNGSGNGGSNGADNEAQDKAR